MLRCARVALAVLLTALALPSTASAEDTANWHTIYIATPAASGTTNADTDNTNAAVRAVIEVANKFRLSAVSLQQSFDPSSPGDICSATNTALSRRQAQAPNIQKMLADSLNSANAGTQSVQSDSLVKPGDLVLVLALTRADQTYNKYTGVYTDDVLLNLTQIDCGHKVDNIAALARAGLPPGVISGSWRAANTGAIVDHYYANSVSGIAEIAALLTSPWVGKYRLWLTVPAKVVDSFKHEKKALEGAIYCAAADATLDTLYQNGFIRLKQVGNQLHALELENAESTKGLRVQGVNRCGRQQPVPADLTQQRMEDV